MPFDLLLLRVVAIITIMIALVLAMAIVIVRVVLVGIVIVIGIVRRRIATITRVPMSTKAGIACMGGSDSQRTFPRQEIARHGRRICPLTCLEETIALSAPQIVATLQIEPHSHDLRL